MIVRASKVPMAITGIFPLADPEWHNHNIFGKKTNHETKQIKKKRLIEMLVRIDSNRQREVTIEVIF